MPGRGLLHAAAAPIQAQCHSGRFASMPPAVTSPLAALRRWPCSICSLGLSPCTRTQRIAMSQTLLSPLPALEAPAANADTDHRAAAPLAIWWLGAILFAALTAAVLLGALEWEHYRRIL